MSKQHPTPADALRVLVEKKRSYPSPTKEVVDGTTHWIQALLKDAKVAFNLSECEEADHYGFSTFYLQRWTGHGFLTLQLKVTEISEKPYVFAHVLKLGEANSYGFPFFQCLSDENGRDLFLNYLADFLLSTEDPDSVSS